MDKNSFIQAAHSGKGRFRVEGIKIITGDKDLLGKGFLEIIPGDFKLSVILEADAGHNLVPEGYRTQNQFWHITGVIEEEIQFKIRDLPSGSSFHAGMGVPTRSVLEFSTSHMELPAIGLDAMTHQQAYDLQQAAMQQLPIAPVFKNPGSSPQPNAAHNVQVEFKGVLRDFKLIEHNANTEIITKDPFLGDRPTFKRNVFHGEFAEWKYGLIENGDDLEIYFNSKPEYVSQGEEHDKRLWQAFLQSIAFTHGQHPWPFLLQHRRDGKLVSEICKAEHLRRQIRTNLKS